MENKYTYSIIIPHKNIPKLLQRCLDSIPERDDVEVIVVDDNSDPAIVDFDHFPGKERLNTTVVFDKSGKGAGRARNVGLEKATGKWLIFADADDMFESGIDSILTKLNSEEADLVYFGVITKDSISLEITNESKYFSDILKRQDEFALRYELLTPWMKAIRKSMVDENQILFEEVSCGNDTSFSALCGYYAKRIGVYKEIGYCWMQREGSLWRKKDINWYVVRYGVDLRIASFMKRKKEKQAEAFFLSHAWYLINELSTYSQRQYVKGCMCYGLTTRDFQMFFRTIPHICLNYIKKRIFSK